MFGELSFIDHGEVPINRTSKLQFLWIYDGATSLTTAYAVQNRTDSLTISHPQEYFETYQLNPKYIVADQAFMGTELEEYYNRQNIRPISLGPGTPRPNQAEAASRMFKRQVHLMLTSLKDDPLLACLYHIPTAFATGMYLSKHHDYARGQFNWHSEEDLPT